jgi:hypothetical protein
MKLLKTPINIRERPPAELLRPRCVRTNRSELCSYSRRRAGRLDPGASTARHRFARRRTRRESTWGAGLHTLTRTAWVQLAEGAPRLRGRRCSEELARWFNTGACSAATPIHLTKPARTNRTQEQGTEKRADTKSNKNRPKTKGFAPKLSTGEIRPRTNIFPKNHRMGLTQTPRKSDCRKNEK